MMPVCENSLIVKILSEPDAAGLQEQFGVSRFAGFYSGFLIHTEHVILKRTLKTAVRLWLYFYKLYC